MDVPVDSQPYVIFQFDAANDSCMIVILGGVFRSNDIVFQFDQKCYTRQSRKHAENPRDTAVFEASGCHEDFFEKTKNPF